MTVFCVVRTNAMRFRLRTLLIVIAAAGLWITVLALACGSHGFGHGAIRYVMPPFVLIGMTLAIQRLVRGWGDAWPTSALASGLIGLVSLLAAWWSATHF
jgi:hypothetical protein